MNWLDAELIALLVSVIAGFAALFVQIGRWRAVVEQQISKLSELDGRMTAHEKHCSEREEKQHERESTIQKQLSEGQARFIRIETNQENIREDLTEIKEMLRERSVR